MTDIGSEASFGELRSVVPELNSDVEVECADIES